MKIILSQHIISEPLNASLWVPMHKEYDSNIIPHKGDLISDSAYESDVDGMEVVQVAIDYKSNSCYVNIAPMIVETTERKLIEEYRDMMVSHGWKHF